MPWRTSRLGRDTADELNIQKRLKFADIRFIAVAQGIDSENEQAQVLMIVHGMVDSLYVQELGKKTHRGHGRQSAKGSGRAGAPTATLTSRRRKGSARKSTKTKLP